MYSFCKRRDSKYRIAKLVSRSNKCFHKKCALKNKGVEKYNGKHNLVTECFVLSISKCNVNSTKDTYTRNSSYLSSLPTTIAVG
jgi:hypothetical protein